MLYVITSDALAASLDDRSRSSGPSPGHWVLCVVTRKLPWYRTRAPWPLPLVLLKSLRLHTVLQGELLVIQWCWWYMTMRTKTCQLLPIFREVGGNGPFRVATEYILTPPTPPTTPPSHPATPAMLMSYLFVHINFEAKSSSTLVRPFKVEPWRRWGTI